MFIDSEDKTTDTAQQSWTTYEELLLACATNKHGVGNWDSVAMELQNRAATAANVSPPPFTPRICRDKFDDLRRRFALRNHAGSSDGNMAKSIIEKLREIRIRELRREVQECDISILSLELKVKKLKEDREKEEADLTRMTDWVSPETVARKSTFGGEDSGSGWSFNESNNNSSIHFQRKPETTAGREQNDSLNEGAVLIKPEPGRTRPGSDPERIRGWSWGGQLGRAGGDDVDNASFKIGPNEAAGQLGGSTELGEKERQQQQSSDVQSSASLSLQRKKRRRRGGKNSRSGAVTRVDNGSSGGEEPEAGGDEVSAATKRLPRTVKSQSLVHEFLRIIRSHRLGSVFERQPPRSQESQRYKNLIREHIDLQTVQLRLDKGTYSNCTHKFFRDLLLLFNNALVFFRKNSLENLAAHELRTLVLKEMREKLHKPEPQQQPETAKPEAKQAFPVPKPSSKSSNSTVKRGSSKTVSEHASKKGDKKEKEVGEKLKLSEKKIEESGSSSLVRIEEKGSTTIRKKRTNDRSAQGRRNSRTSNGNGGETKHQYGGNVISSHDALEAKVDRKESNVKKRQGAASFLKRMKQNSPSDTKDSSDDDDGGGGGGEDEGESEDKEEESKDSKRKNQEKKRRGSGKREEIIKRVTRSSGERAKKEEISEKLTRKGRPPRNQAASTVERGGGAVGKRGRDGGEGNGAGRAKKRSRR